jgi:acylphosphatase
MLKIRAHIFIEGRVQGVFFRARATERAVRLGVRGWIRNLPNGKVEGVFEGEEENVNALLDFCKVGPSSAEVEKVDVEKSTYTGAFEDFRIRYR